MAGYLNSEILERYAIIEAKVVLSDEFLKELNASFEQDPDKCVCVQIIEFLNCHYVDELVKRHPDFRPIAETFKQEQREGSTHPADLYSKLFNSSVKLAVTEPYKYDVSFNAMMAAIMYNFFSDETRQEFSGAFFGLFEQCKTEIYDADVLLFACALWGADYENFRKLTTSKYYELKAQGFDQDVDEPEIISEEKQLNNLLTRAKENVDHYDEKLHFISDINERVASDIDSLDSQVEIGKEYVRYYIEIERYYVDPLDRMKFIAFCSDALPETLLKNGGFVPLDYFMGQFEKCLQSLNTPDKRIAFIRTLAMRAKSVAGWEMIGAIADGDFDVASYGWERVCEYIYNKSEEWGWDRYLEDAEQWDYIPHAQRVAQAEVQKAQQSTPTQTTLTSNSNNNYSSTSGSRSGGCYVATAVYGSYDCPEVWALRRFRDYSLAKAWYGRTFIKLYYTVSPALVRWFGDAKWFQQFWKGRLDRLVAKLRAEGYDSTPYSD